MGPIRIALAQINPTVGNLEGNAKKIIQGIKKAVEQKADLIVFPELALTGYPPEDLLFKPKFIEDNINLIHQIAQKTGDIVAIIGFVDRTDDIHNAAAVIYNGRVQAVYRKMYLPNYGVFDEERYFKAGREPLNILIDRIKLGISICEDIWYPQGPALIETASGAQIVINLGASPYHFGKREFRKKMLTTRAVDYACFVVFVNLVGGQDELVFDGGSMIIDANGDIIAQAKIFEEDFLVADINPGESFRRRLFDPRQRKESLQNIGEAKLIEIKKKISPKLSTIKPRIEPDPDPREEILKALVLGTRDYVKKNSFQKVLVGLSGGIDSSLVAAIAVEALGKENVVGVVMPSRFTSKESIEDAEALAKNLGIETIKIEIEEIFQHYLRKLRPVFQQLPWSSAEENLQARIRGNILMAISNKFGYLVLATGNKSEMSVGYTTLYGDMAGGFAVIKDLFKTEVYKIARYINEKHGREIIPERVFIKPPSAELRKDQKDEEDLAPYKILDPILKLYIEEERSFDEIVAQGFDPKLVKRVINMVDQNEYKRRQAPPGIKITARAFGKDRRLPITNAYKPYTSNKVL